jgi:hypothetical protein
MLLLSLRYQIPTAGRIDNLRVFFRNGINHKFHFTLL